MPGQRFPTPYQGAGLHLSCLPCEAFVPGRKHLSQGKGENKQTNGSARPSTPELGTPNVHQTAVSGHTGSDPPGGRHASTDSYNLKGAGWPETFRCFVYSPSQPLLEGAEDSLLLCALRPWGSVYPLKYAPTLPLPDACKGLLCSSPLLEPSTSVIPHLMLVCGL